MVLDAEIPAESQQVLLQAGRDLHTGSLNIFRVVVFLFPRGADARLIGRFPRFTKLADDASRHSLEDFQGNDYSVLKQTEESRTPTFFRS